MLRGGTAKQQSSCLPEVKSCLLSAEEVREKKEAIRGVVEKPERENMMTMGEIGGGHAKTTSKTIVAKKQRDDGFFINSDDKKNFNY